MIGIVSIGRSLLLRQILLALMVAAVGIFAYSSVHGVEDAARAFAADPKTVGESAAVLAAAERASSAIFYATIIAAFLMVGVSLPIMHVTIGRPLTRMADSLEHLAAGDMGAAIEGEDRRDALGRMARALRTIRATLSETAGAETSRSVPANSEHDIRARAMADRVEGFSVDLSHNVKRLAAMARRLGEAADTMIVSARHASDGSDQATGASAHAAADVSSVATASEQLLDSIEEISRQVVQSTNVVKAAVERAVDTNAGMGRLSAAAQKVGDVVSLISRIAAQTNLLALNATIEAARAGEAGRGFAVVAQEVKVLATQTAKATQDITGQIAEMQEATDRSVEAIDKIQTKIGEVEHISTIIAAAVHEQGAATQEIARNVRSAAAGTATMSSHIEHVVRSVGDTSSSATSVSNLARELDGIATGMTEMVESFARNLKAA